MHDFFSVPLVVALPDASEHEDTVAKEQIQPSFVARYGRHGERKTWLPEGKRDRESIVQR